jgi:uncharacterized protein YdeI (YjbR/CyaY-like superfamily)
VAKHDDAEQLQFSRRAEWRAWLKRHHATSTGVWVVYGKKTASFPSPTYLELVLEALCFGWIDSKPGRVDDERTRLYFCPRKPASVWAATNKGRVEQLTAEGLMTPSGQAVIDRAKADGSWSALDSSDSLAVPPDLAAAFDSYPGSCAIWDAFPDGVRKQHIYWVEDAKRPETRAKRVDEVARLAQQGIRANQWKPKSP